ncbi:glycine betaine ABC transporter substrate-binding protein [Brevibacterium zhoupengii]|uniref:glycine betaine ABC transporter substrate-binding protein n=1 Tax=Brevibacterium zhoupengii TaxID=2898795 RepID=UPI001E5FC464|nr:glycine betaine ABC transporter substrate-binding protein [Brevibacterium zhoupengii]
MKSRALNTALAACAALGLALTGCSQEAAKDSGSDGDKGKLTIGYISSWTDSLSTAFLLEDQFEKLGFDVELESMSEAAIVYAGVANGDIDVYPSAWPERTHKKYMDEYGDKIEDLGTYFDEAKNTLVVPSYVDIDSMDELVDNADKFGGKIIGIEPGAGLTAMVKDSVIPTYGLDKDFELVTSSTPAMLTELGNAIEAKEDIVVTLWRPFWANNAYDVKDLKDPKHAMGDPEGMHFLGTKGFSDEFPEAADLVKGIKLDDKQYGDLENLVVNEYEDGEESDAVDQWLKENPKAFDTEITD